MSLKYTPVAQSIPCLIFFMYVRAYNVFTMIDKNLKHNLQFLILTLSLKQGQGHQTWYELVDPSQARLE